MTAFNRILSILLLYISFNCQAQHWIQPSATFNYYYQVQQSSRYEQLRYIKDTVHMGRTCSMLDKHSQTYAGIWWPVLNEGNLYLNKQNDSVFIADTSGWRLLFVLNAQAGIVWDYGPPSNAYPGCNVLNMRTAVDSTRMDTINNIPIKKLFVRTLPGSDHGYSGYITDRFGPAKSYIDWQKSISPCIPAVASPAMYYLTCYCDSSFGAQCPVPFVSPTGIPNIITVEHDPLRLFPNPCSEELTVQYSRLLKNDPTTIAIYTMEGKLICSKDLFAFSNATEFSVKDLPNGVYSVQIMEIGYVIASKLLIILK